MKDNDNQPNSDPGRQQPESPPSYYGSYPYAHYGTPYYGAGQAGHTDLAATIRRVLTTLRRRWLTIVLAAFFGLCIGAYRVWTAPRIYQASGLIEMHARRPRILDREGAILEDRAYSWKSESIINTRIQKLRGKETRERVVQYLREKGDAQPQHLAAASFSQIPESFLVRITCRHTDPERAAVSADAYAEVTRKLALEENRADSENAVAWLKSQAAAQKEVLEEAEATLMDFRTRHKLDLVLSRKTTASVKVERLNSELVGIRSRQVQAQDLCTTLDNIDINIDAMGKLPSSTPGADVIRQSVAQWRRAIADRETLLVKYRPQHPKVQAAGQVVSVRRNEVLEAVEQAGRSAQANVDLLKQQAASIKEEMETYRALTAELELKIVQLNGELDGLQRAKQTANMSYQGILRRIEEARLSADENTTTVKIVEQASVPVAPVSPNARSLFMFSLLLGLIAGGGLAFLKELLDDLISSSGDIEESLGLRVLGLVPYREKAARRDLARTTLKQGSHAMAEAFASIRTLLCSSHNRESTTSLLVTSTAPEEGKTVVACNLAITFARSGMKTLLVDFDLRRPRIGRIFSEIQDAEPLLAVLKDEEAGNDDFSRLPRSTDCRNLDVITNRADKEISPAEIVGGATVERFMKWAVESYDQVVFDSPPHGLLSDAGVLAGQVSGVLLVCWANKTRRHSLRQAARHFDELGANVLGVVVNGVKFGRNGYFGSYDYYHRGYYQPKYHEAEQGKA